jgi:hypothetical protein
MGLDRLEPDAFQDLREGGRAGGMLGAAGLMYVLISRKSVDLWYRAGVAAAVGTALLLAWVNVAVGIMGGENNPANWMYLGVPAVALAGVLLARMQAGGMALAMWAAALAQVLVTATGLVIMKLQGAAAESPMEMVVIVGATVFFTALWVGAGLLFRRTRARKPEGERQAG